MKRFLYQVTASVLLIGIYGQAMAALIVYTNETDYLAGLTVYGYDVISEGFESDEWDPTRNPSSVSSITVQGLNWSSSDAISTISSLWTRTGTYGIFDTYGDPDEIYTVSSTDKDLYAAAGWFNFTTAENINIVLDGTIVTSLDFTGASVHQFLGAIETDGISNVAFTTSSGHFGADDFTFGVKASSVPEPSIGILLGFSLLGYGLTMCKRK